MFIPFSFGLGVAVDDWKPFLWAVLIAAALWMLHPPRELSPTPPEDNVITLKYMGPGGHLQGSMVDVIRAFERWSRKRHAQNPQKYPHVYRVLVGQTAAYDTVADPTRFLVTVAGGEPRRPVDSGRPCSRGQGHLDHR